MGNMDNARDFDDAKIDNNSNTKTLSIAYEPRNDPKQKQTMGDIVYCRNVCCFVGCVMEIASNNKK